MYNEYLLNILSLLSGLVTGYVYGISLVKQGRGLLFNPAFSLIRMLIIAGICAYLLHWGLIPFILFLGSFTVTMWLIILLQKE